MLHFVTGRAGTGKTARIREEIVREMTESDRPVVILVPEQQTVAWETAMARLLPPSANLRLEITNFTRLANAVFREYGGLADPVIDEGSRTLVVWRAMLSVWEELTVYRRGGDDAGRGGREDRNLPALTEAVDELKAAGISPGKAEEALRMLEEIEAERAASRDPLTGDGAERRGGCGDLLSRFRDAVLVYAAYEDILHREAIDRGDLPARLADTLAEHPYFRGKAVFMDSFYSLTLPQEKILYRIPSDFRESVYRELQEKVQILTAPRIYQYYIENKPGFDMLMKLAAEFRRDDHHFWEELKNDPPENKDGPSRFSREQKWDDRAKDTKEMAAVSGNEASSEKGSLSWLLSFEADDKTDYREFLRRFMTIREEVRIDPDGFDYGYYHFGMEMFGNMPLIEENEYREEIGIDQLVIAVDTSASTRQEQLQEFLNGTAAILSAQETFFHHVHIHLIECDDQVQNDILITDVSALKQYAGSMEIKGGMGTDFRPVFTYVEDLIRRGKLNDLRGLMYFTDGYGTFPSDPTPYDTAFVFCKELDHDDTGVPDWAVKLYV